MLAISKLKARSLDVDRMEVTWETTNESMDVWDYTFQVLRSESPAGPFDPVSPVFEDRFIFVDSQIPGGDRFRQLWYKLRVTKKSDSEVEDHGPATQEPEPDLIAQYVRRAEQLLFSQFTGRQCWLFKKRTFGPRCTSCWDRITKKRMRSGCLECFDTGFLRGFFNPIVVWVQIDPSAKSKQMQAQQSNQETHTTGRMSYYPTIRPGDLIVEAENKRWEIVVVTASERLRATIMQRIEDMRQIELTDIEYKLPLNLDQALKDIQPSPARMFTNPADLNAYVDELIPEVFANYSTLPRDPQKDER